MLLLAEDKIKDTSMEEEDKPKDVPEKNGKESDGEEDKNEKTLEEVCKDIFYWHSCLSFLLLRMKVTKNPPQKRKKRLRKL
jgi:hypothetical protein